MGDLSDLGCVYHLGRDAGTTIHANLCSNVSSFDYGAMGYYLDQASRFVTLTDNVAHDIKCAGFMQVRSSLILARDLAGLLLTSFHAELWHQLHIREQCWWISEREQVYDWI